MATYQNEYMDLIIQTDRLTVRPLAMEDIDLVIDLFTDEEVTRYFSDEPMTEKEISNNMHLYIRRGIEGAIGIWCICDNQSDEKLGTVALLPLPINIDDTDWNLLNDDQPLDYEVEVGYFLKPQAWGKGLATEAAKAMVDFYFENLDCEELVGIIDDKNNASRNVLLKSGLKEIGRRKAYQMMCPGFVITRSEWLARNE